jgi:hypothetical protein
MILLHTPGHAACQGQCLLRRGPGRTALSPGRAAAHACRRFRFSGMTVGTITHVVTVAGMVRPDS